MWLYVLQVQVIQCKHLQKPWPQLSKHTQPTHSCDSPCLHVFKVHTRIHLCRQPTDSRSDRHQPWMLISALICTSGPGGLWVIRSTAGKNTGFPGQPAIRWLHSGASINLHRSEASTTEPDASSRRLWRPFKQLITCLMPAILLVRVPDMILGRGNWVGVTIISCWCFGWIKSRCSLISHSSGVWSTPKRRASFALSGIKHWFLPKVSLWC